MINYVKTARIFLLSGAIDNTNGNGNGNGNDTTEKTPWLIMSESGDKITSKYDDLKDYFLDVAAASILSVDYMFKTDESAQVLGLYSANIIDSESSKSSGWYMIKNPSMFIKLIKIWTSTLAVRNKGTIKLNYVSSTIMKALDVLVEPFLSEKVKNRKKTFGKDWIENNGNFFVVDKLPKCYGGGLEDE